MNKIFKDSENKHDLKKYENKIIQDLKKDINQADNISKNLKKTLNRIKGIFYLFNGLSKNKEGKIKSKKEKLNK